MLELDEARVTLGSASWRFSLALEADSVNVLLGRSGSGKSTLLNLVAGFLEPEAGDVRWQGRSLVGLAPDRRPVNTLFQHHNLFAHLTVRDNVGLGLHPGLRLSAADRGRVAEALERVGLAAHAGKRPPALSGGERQRVALARCLLRRKPILLMDEPFGALDGATRAEMLALAREVIASYAPCAIVVTHEPDDARALGASVLRLENGAVRARGGEEGDDVGRPDRGSESVRTPRTRPGR